MQTCKRACFRRLPRPVPARSALRLRAAGLTGWCRWGDGGGGGAERVGAAWAEAWRQGKWAVATLVCGHGKAAPMQQGPKTRPEQKGPGREKLKTDIAGAGKTALPLKAPAPLAGHDKKGKGKIQPRSSQDPVLRVMHFWPTDAIIKDAAANGGACGAAGRRFRSSAGRGMCAGAVKAVREFEGEQWPARPRLR